MNAPRGSSDNSGNGGGSCGELAACGNGPSITSCSICTAESSSPKVSSSGIGGSRPESTVRVDRARLLAASDLARRVGRDLLVGHRRHAIGVDAQRLERRRRLLLVARPFVDERGQPARRRQIEQPMATRRALGLVGKIEPQIGVAHRRRGDRLLRDRRGHARRARPALARLRLAVPRARRLRDRARPRCVSSRSRPERVASSCAARAHAS